MAGHDVLLIGFDPRSVPGVDATLVETAMAMGDVRLKQHGFDADYCLVAPDAGDTEFVDALRGKDYDCVVVGGGIRKPEPFLELFERVVNLIRVHAPAAADRVQHERREQRRRRVAVAAGRGGRDLSVGPDETWPSTVQHGPLASMLTIYETPDGRRCIVTFANRGADALSPVRNDRGELWVGYLLAGDAQPEHFEDWERGWVAAELLRPVGAIDDA